MNPPYPGDDWVGQAQADIEALYRQAGQDPNSAKSAVWIGRTLYDIGAGMPKELSKAKHLAELTQALGLPSQAPLLARLTTAGQFFRRETGEYFTARQCSDFNLLNRWQRGEDIDPVLAQRAACGFNLLRVWTLFDIPGIGRMPSCDYVMIPEFVARCASFGLYVEFTAYTGINDPLHWERLCQAALISHPEPLLELVNELDQNTNEPDSDGRVFDLSLHDQPGGLLTSHGSNGSQAQPVQPPWTYEVMHYNDSPEWWRKTGHNSMSDAADISGRPCSANENTRFDHDQNMQHAFDAAAGAALLCAGACCHTPRGKTSELWDGAELEWAMAWANGAKSVSLEAQDGRYVHAVELEGPDDLRVYQRVLADGRAFTVRIRK
jgi:hypothetical protein